MQLPNLVCKLMGIAVVSAQWFLTEEEIDASRGGHSRLLTGIPVMSGSNAVEALVNGQPFMLRLLEDIRATQSGDWIHATMFEVIAPRSRGHTKLPEPRTQVNGDMMLDPTEPSPANTTLSTGGVPPAGLLVSEPCPSRILHASSMAVLCSATAGRRKRRQTAHSRQ